jgi:hypothetical protein
MHSKHPGKVPSFKFTGNDGWIVAGDECTVIATHLREFAKHVTQDKLDEMGREYTKAKQPMLDAMSKNGEKVLTSNEMIGMSLADYRSWINEWAAYNEIAAKHKGYRVE